MNLGEPNMPGIRTTNTRNMKHLLMSVVLLAAPALAKDVPPSPRTYVHNEGILSASGEQAVSRKLAAFEKATGHQMVVAAFNSLDGDNLEGYSNRLFKAWKIGDAKRNDGLLFAMFKADRKWRVEVGYGFEGTLTDLEAFHIATDAAVPSFKRGNFDGGVSAVVDALQARLTAPDAPKPVPHHSAPASEDNSGLIVLLVTLGLVGLVGLLIWAFSGDDDKPEPPSKKPSKRDRETPRTYVPIYVPPAPTYEPPYTPPSRSDYGVGSSFGGGGSDFGGFSGGGGDSGGGGASGGW